MVKADPEQVVACLIQARDLIARPDGWLQGAESEWTSRNGVATVKYCAVGAINAAGLQMEIELPKTRFRPIRADALMALYNALPWPKGIACVNDDPNTTQADMVVHFNRAIQGVELGADAAAGTEFTTAA